MYDISSLLLLSLGTAHGEHLTATPQFLSERERRSPSITTVEMEGRLQVSSPDFHTLRTEFLEEMI